MFDEILGFLGMVGSGFIFALGFRGCDAFLELVVGHFKCSRKKKAADQRPINNRKIRLCTGILVVVLNSLFAFVQLCSFGASSLLRFFREQFELDLISVKDPQF